MRAVVMALSVTALLAASGAGWAASIYRWLDGEGRVHYGDAPPAGVNFERLDVRVPRPGASEEEERDDRLARELARINRQIESLRDLRAAKLGLTRDQLDRYERRLVSPASPPQPAPATSAAPPDTGAARQRDAYYPYLPVYAPAIHGLRRHPPTSDAFRPRGRPSRSRHPHRSRRAVEGRASFTCCSLAPRDD